MNTLMILILCILVLAVLVLIHYALNNEDKVVKKAEKNKFYHVLAKLTSSTYSGYTMNDDEKKSMKEYLSKPSEYDSHAIGSYFSIRQDLKSILSMAGNFHNYKLNFNLGEIGTGFAVLAVFALVVTLGVIYG